MKYFSPLFWEVIIVCVLFGKGVLCQYDKQAEIVAAEKQKENSQEVIQTEDRITIANDTGYETEEMRFNTASSTEEDEFLLDKEGLPDFYKFETLAELNTDFQVPPPKTEFGKMDTPTASSCCFESHLQHEMITEEVYALSLLNLEASTETTLLSINLSSHFTHIYNKLSNFEKDFQSFQSQFDSEKSNTFSRFNQLQLNLENETKTRETKTESDQKDLNKLADVVKTNKEKADKDIEIRKKSNRKS